MFRVLFRVPLEHQVIKLSLRYLFVTCLLPCCYLFVTRRLHDGYNRYMTVARPLHDRSKLGGGTLVEHGHVTVV